MEIQKLKDICLTEITDGTHQTPTYSEYGYIFLSSKNVTTQKIDWDNVMFIPEKLHEELYKRVAPQIDDILLAKNGTTGVAAIVDRDIVFDIYVSLALIRPNTEIVMPRYLLYAINNPVVKGYFDSSLKGIGVPNLHLKNIRETPIKIYDLETQKAIVEKLDKVCELISLRKQQLAKLDELVKARFVEMFGEPAANPNRYKKKKLSEIAVYFNGLTYKPENVSDEGTIVLRSSNIQNGKLDFEDVVRVDCAVKEKFVVKENDILMCSRNGSSRLVGKVALIKNVWEPMSFGAFMMIIRSDYYWYLMTYFQMASFREQIKAGTTTTINQITGRMLDSIMIPLPPVDVQNQFATFAERVDKQKQTVQQSLEKLELMKKALMQEYFG